VPPLRTPERKSQNPSSKIQLPAYTRLIVIPSASERSPEISLITHRNLCDQSTTVRSLTSFGMTELRSTIANPHFHLHAAVLNFAFADEQQNQTPWHRIEF
jgi:hypothetical protein